ncbi:MAG: tripartite tricarboxylate transporter substrate binding protein [Clostridiaceae bacterium]|nr:tripartite tricarboxylate transporter substrate binding protein [Clostridiaceae bacterium]
MRLGRSLVLMLIMVMVVSLYTACSEQAKAPETPAGETPTKTEESKEIDYPTKNITLVNPWSAGGGTDVVARSLANELGKILGQTVIVVNKTGGSGAVGINEVKNAAPDGYTLLINDKSFVSSYFMGVTDIKYDELDTVCRLDAASQGIVVNSKSPWKTPQEFIEAAKANPGKMTIGVSGIGGMAHLLAENFKLTAGIDVKMVSYEGAGPSRAALAGGHVDAISAQLGEVNSFIESGDLRLLAIGDTERHPSFPDVPTFMESGVDFDLNQWRAIWVPKGTPRPVIDKLSAAVKQAMETESMKKLLADTFTQNMYIGPDELKAELDRQDEVLGELVNDAGLLKK